MNTITLINAQQGHTAMQSAWSQAKALLMAGHRLRLSIKPETRSTAQNARMWSMLEEVAQQVTWHGRKLSKEDWKNVFSASLKKQDAVPGIDGGFVVLGQSTSKMTIREMSDLMALMEAFGAEHEVRFSAPENWK